MGTCSTGGLWNRRKFLRGTLGISSVALRARAQPAPRPPNFVIILADDLGYGDLSSFGATAHKTPNLDRMAAEGVRFTDFYTPMPFCAPTRASLLTGRYPFHHGVTSNPAPDGGNNDIGLPASEITIAEALKPLGYASICIGKWHLGHVEKFLPRTQGFDEYYGILYSNDMRPVQLVHNEKVAHYPVVQAGLTQDYTDRAIRFMEQNRDRPFLVYLPHAMPHKPLAASEDFYTPDTPADLYSDVLRELDHNIGRVLDSINRLSLNDNTLVIFTSDNGPWFGGSTAGLRGMKGSSWEGGIRVPMIARWPGRIPAGLVCGEMAGVIDILPTVCSLAGAPPPSGRKIDGRDIWPLMSRPGAKTPHEALFSMSNAQLQTVRSGKWKLHVRRPAPGSPYLEDASRWVDPRGPDGLTLIAQHEQARPDNYPGVRTGDEPGEMMLFDLEADRAEQHNVAARHPDVVARLKGIYDKVAAEIPQRPPGENRGANRGLMRLKGGELRYDRLPQHPGQPR
jgi:uncharacterized sulfatase